MRLRHNVLWKLRRHYATDSDTGALAKLLGPRVRPTQGDVDELLEELRGSSALREALDSPVARQWNRGFNDARGQAALDQELALATTGRGRAILLYLTTRLARPATVIETGCFTGWDSAVILQALAKNGEGRLVSIDLPAEPGKFSQLAGRPRAGLPPDLPVGFLVPEALRSRWTLVIDDVRNVLPSLLAELDSVGIFFHDSDHTYAHMMWEYTTALPKLSPGGILVSDDISWNTALWDLAAGIGTPLVVHERTPNVGAIRAGHEGSA